jgi:Bim protein N-terminus
MRLLTISALAGLGLALSACGTFGQKVELSLADLQTRCDARGGQLAPTGRQTGTARLDHACFDRGHSRHISRYERGVGATSASEDYGKAVNRSL